MESSENKKKKICRICLGSHENKSISLFEKYNDYLIYNHINAIANIEIVEGDGLPDKICSSCLLEFETAIKFKQKCQNSNIILQTSKLQSLTEANVKLEFDIQGLGVKKEEPIEEEILGYYDFLDPSELFDSEDEKPPNLNKVELGLRKSRALDLKLQCHDCGNYFKSKCKLRVHWKTVHLPSMLICQKCKRTFKSIRAFNRHQKIKQESCQVVSKVRIEGEGKSRVFYCNDCDYKSKRPKDMKTHLVTHTGDRPYQCQVCTRSFTQLGVLQDHMEIVHKDFRVEITCQFCGKYVRGRRNVYRHLSQHKSQETQCDICKKVYKNKKILKVHMLRHSGVKSYTCELCASRFYSSGELSNHKRNVHEKGQHWYSCNECEFKTTRSTNIKKHKMRHTGTNFPCTVCGMFFQTVQKLIFHQRRHFGDKKHSCPHCGLKFLRRDSVTKHIKAKHTGNVNKTPVKVKAESPNVVKIEIS